MKVIDHRKLAKLMLIQDVSHRELAEALGWKAHSYVGRIVRGQVKNVDAETAVRIALHLGVGVDDLFVARSSNDAGRSVQHKRMSRAS